MPQMNPMMWTSIFLSVIWLLFLVLVFIHFFFSKSVEKLSPKESFFKETWLID